MMPACRLARSARRDLQEIADYLTSEAGEQRALEIIARVLETFVTMSAHPGAGVYYRPWSKGIEILHVFHGARDQKKAWKVSRAKPRRE
jgi:plasmid stabilization system protein ParE